VKSRLAVPFNSFVPALAAALVAAVSPAFAQTNEVFDASTFRPASGGDGIIGVEGARVPNVHDQVLDVKLWGLGEHAPLKLGSEQVYNRVRGILAIQAKVADGFAIGLQLPYTLNQYGVLTGGLGAAGATQTGLGDIRLTPRIGLLQQNRHVINMAVQASFTLPIADKGTLAGYGSPQVDGSLNLSHIWGDEGGAHVELIGNVLVGTRSTFTADQTSLGGVFLGGRIGAASYFGEELLRRVFAELEAKSYTSYWGSTFATPVEGRAGLTLCYGKFLALDLFAGARNVQAAGSPDWHAGFSIGYSPTTCRTTVPPLPGPSAEEIAAKKAADEAAAKKAADEKAAADKLAAEKAAAEKAAADAAAKVAAEKAAAEAAAKKAAEEAARKAEEEAAKKDTDGDGVPDRVDNCPTEPGPASNFGCPLTKKQKVAVRDGKIDILDKVQFATGKATILGASYPLLDQVATVLKGHPEIVKVEVQGHTDNVGNPEKNLKLSQARSESVAAYLVKKGVSKEILDAKGYGDTKPIADNKTKAGQNENRRVEFKVVETKKAQ
jgi:outer membrane protein OmpA-like peptidoglycan-associated protein